MNAFLRAKKLYIDFKGFQNNSWHKLGIKKMFFLIRKKS